MKCRVDAPTVAADLAQARHAYSKQTLMSVVAAAVSYQAELEHKDGADETMLSARIATLWTTIGHAYEARQKSASADKATVTDREVVLLPIHSQQDKGGRGAKLLAVAYGTRKVKPFWLEGRHASKSDALEV